jgi:hypothetical protein
MLRLLRWYQWILSGHLRQLRQLNLLSPLDLGYLLSLLILSGQMLRLSLSGHFLL